MEIISDKIKMILERWYLALVWGALFICLSGLSFLCPEEGYTLVIILVSGCLLSIGLTDFFTNGSYQSDRWNLVGCIISVVMVAILFLLPFSMETSASYVLAFWLFQNGISAFGLSLQLKRLRVKIWKGLLVYAIYAIISSILTLYDPFTGIIMSFILLLVIYFSYTKVLSDCQI